MKIILVFTLLAQGHWILAQMNSYSTAVERSEKMNFLFYHPEKELDSYPLVVFLHGGGESGDSVELLKKNGIPRYISEGKEYPFYMFAPQNPYRSGLFDSRMIDFMIDQLVDTLSLVDTTRIYLVGMSRGGNAAWMSAVNNPGKYAALLSICAASIPINYLRRAGPIPVWFFHGEDDPVIPVTHTLEAYESLKQHNPNLKLTIYPGVRHGAWVPALEDEEVYEWLLAQSLN